MAGAPHFSVRPECRDASPRPAGTGWAVNVQSEVLQQLATLIPVGLAVHPDVVNRFGEQGRRALDFHRPSGLVPDSDVVLSTTAHGASWVFALDGDFTIAGIKVHLGDFGVFRQD